LANNGQTSAWLKRRSELTEVLASEKRGNHPLKTFINFTQGKLTDNDSLILTTSNIFNYISFELFSKILDQMPLEQACAEISNILQSSMSEDIAFSSFLMNFTKRPALAVEESQVAIPITNVIPEDTIPQQEIYAPLPEEESTIESVKSRMQFKVPSFPKFSLPIPNFRLPVRFSLPVRKISIPTLNFGWLQKIRTPQYFQNLSKAGKFFFISFAIFLLLFLINLAIYAGKLQGKKTQDKIEALVEKVNQDIQDANSALIYNGEAQALEKLNQTIADLDELAKLDPAKAAELTPKLEQVKTVVNKINTVAAPTVFLDLKRHPTFVTPTSVGLLFGNQDSNSLSRYDETLTDYFLLNSLKSPLTSIDYTSTTGVIVSSGNQIFRIDPTLKQFEPVVSIENGDLYQMLVVNNFIYALDRTNDQIVKITYTNKYKTQVSISGDVAQARDFGVDKDIYVLYPEKITKYVAGKAQSFPMPKMTDQLTNGDKIIVASNLYILEGNKKRIIVLNKNGALVNQIYFPTTTDLTDFYVEESSRSLFLLDDNKLYKVTI
jgi:hypothetical protein